MYRADFENQPLKYRNSPLIDDYLVNAYRVQAQQAKDYGLIRREVSVDGWFDARFLNTALKQLNLEHFWPHYGVDGKPET